MFVRLLKLLECIRCLSSKHQKLKLMFSDVVAWIQPAKDGNFWLCPLSAIVNRRVPQGRRIVPADVALLPTAVLCPSLPL